MTVAPRAILPSVNGWQADYLEAQYQQWKQDPTLVAEDLRQFFQGFDLANSGAGGLATKANGPAAAPSSPVRPGAAAVGGSAAEDRSQAAVSNLIEAYRKFGHLAAAIDPFGRERRGPDVLTPQAHGLMKADMDRTFDAGTLSPDGSALPLRRIIEILDETYCRSVGVEFAHITGTEEWRWLADRMEKSRNKASLSRGERAHVLYQLHRAELFEKFCAKRYPGVKRFSLEGGESLIPLLDQVLERAGELNIDEVVMAMPHRGRLNVLVNIVGKTYEQVFTEFEDAWTEDASTGGGDVKYHRGYASVRKLQSGKSISVCMASNPSHLESAGPVVLGRTRAKQRLIGDSARGRIIPLIMHGDAAVIGQGVVAETFNLSQLDGYHVGGTIHAVVNNLIGFTTGEEDARSSRYCTDLAKMLEIPIFHVNGEDPEAVVHVARLALEYRMTFHKDVVIDMVCYRRHGHNETDEAAFTQPMLYKEIKAKPSVLTTYAERLAREEVISQADLEQIRRSLDEELDRAYTAVKQTPVDPTPAPGNRRWEGITGEWSFDPVETGVKREVLDEVARACGRWPEGFTPHPKLVKILQDRARCVKDDLPLDWGTAEALAVGSMLLDGSIVRLAGQDSRRGTFSHRHAAIRDVNTGDLFVPLNHIRDTLGAAQVRKFGTNDAAARALEARYWVYDSPLSEFSCLAFEYGFSLGSPNFLTMWEAQFGDFANGAQVIIDQFIASAEAKWQRWSGLTLLLPHGYEGQGPEHSSARLERFLQLCGDENMQVVTPTTPAQYFHLLRRQLKRGFRKPLVVASPKSLLRSPAATSRVAELASGSFAEIIDDASFSADRSLRRRVKRVILCAGKVCYDLEARRKELGRQDIAIIRVEQLYPLHTDLLKQVLSGYPKEVELAWVQEEPKNMGGWQHMFISFAEAFGMELPYIGRPTSATPATGSPSKSAEQLDEFLTDAIGPSSKPVVAAH